MTIRLRRVLVGRLVMTIQLGRVLVLGPVMPIGLGFMPAAVLGGLVSIALRSLVPLHRATMLRLVMRRFFHDSMLGLVMTARRLVLLGR